MVIFKAKKKRSETSFADNRGEFLFLLGSHKTMEQKNKQTFYGLDVRCGSTSLVNPKFKKKLLRKNTPFRKGTKEGFFRHPKPNPPKTHCNEATHHQPRGVVTFSWRTIHRNSLEGDVIKPKHASPEKNVHLK